MPTCDHCKREIRGTPVSFRSAGRPAKHYHPAHAPKKVPTAKQEADWRGETELSDEAVSPEDRAAYEAERRQKRRKTGSVKTNIRLRTTGRGIWSRCVTNGVHVTGMELAYVNEDQSFGELRVYFDPKTWNTKTRGLIYTDPGFIKALREALVEMGFSRAAVMGTGGGPGVQYSEQGMQGDDYVSCDVMKAFVAEWLGRYGAGPEARVSPSSSFTKLAQASRRNAAGRR